AVVEGSGGAGGKQELVGLGVPGAGVVDHRAVVSVEPRILTRPDHLLAGVERAAVQNRAAAQGHAALGAGTALAALRAARPGQQSVHCKLVRAAQGAARDGQRRHADAASLTRAEVGQAAADSQRTADITYRTTEAGAAAGHDGGAADGIAAGYGALPRVEAYRAGAAEARKSVEEGKAGQVEDRPAPSKERSCGAAAATQHQRTVERLHAAGAAQRRVDVSDAQAAGLLQHAAVVEESGGAGGKQELVGLGVPGAGVVDHRAVVSV